MEVPPVLWRCIKLSVVTLEKVNNERLLWCKWCEREAAGLCHGCDDDDDDVGEERGEESMTFKRATKVGKKDGPWT